MDIKLKNSFLYKGAMVLALCLLVASLAVVGGVARQGDRLSSKYYFESADFKKELLAYTDQLRVLYTFYKDYARKTDAEKVTEEEISAAQNKLENTILKLQEVIKNNYFYNIEQAEKAQDMETLEKLIHERDQEMAQTRLEFSRTEEQIRKDLVSARDQSYNTLKGTIEGIDYIKYYIKDKSNGEIHSNIGYPIDIEDYLKNKALYSVEFPQKAGTRMKLATTNQFFWENGNSGYLIIPRDLKPTSSIYVNYKHASDTRSQLLGKLLLGLLLMLPSLFAVLYLRRKKQVELGILNGLMEQNKKLPLDLRLVLLLLPALAVLPFSRGIPVLPSDWPAAVYDTVISVLIIAYLAYLYLSIQWVLHFFREKSSFRSQWESCLICRAFRLVRDGFAFKGLVFRAGFILLATCAYGLLLGLALANYPGSGMSDMAGLLPLATAVYFFTVPLYILVKLRKFNNIVLDTEKIVSGNLTGRIEVKGKGILSVLARNIGNMQEGVKKAFEEQVKSERLKAELITNVSHDLKTPLTSIINSVNLLKREGLSAEEQRNYIDILERKAERMRLLIEDLFEASKLSSGAVELQFEKIDIAALLHQALGEFDEKIRDSKLIFKVDAPRQKIYAWLDGRKIWRVFENLISNILKYAMPGTRVYVNLAETPDRVLLTMKNISAYELDLEATEIFERFKRGDKSRNTEGSGLGLAIAKSIVDLHGGKLSIEIDGDLFKVSVEFNRFTHSASAAAAGSSGFMPSFINSLL